MKMLPTESFHPSKTISLDASNSTVTSPFLGGLEVPKQRTQQTLHDLMILFLTQMALNESTQLQKLDLASIMTRLSDFTAPEISRLSATVDDKMRLEVILGQLSEFLSVSKSAQESISSRIITMINDFFTLSLNIDCDIFTFVHQNTTGMFDDLVVPNILVIRSALSKMLNKFPEASMFSIYIPQDDCGSWNVTHYPTFLLPETVSLVVKIVPTLKDTNRIDTQSLQEVINLDLAAGIRPLLIVCTVGTAVSTVHDDIPAIIQLNHEHNCWIHVEGIDAIFYWLLDASMARNFDSMTVDLLKWIPNISLPRMTLFNTNPWIVKDELCLKLKTEPWSRCKNSFNILEDEISDSVPQTSIDIFSNTPPVKQLLGLWTWITFQSPSFLKKRLIDIRQAMQSLKSDLSSLENLLVLSSNENAYRGIMFRYESSTDSSTAESGKELYENLATRFIFSKLYPLIPTLSLISLNSKIYIQLEIFYAEAFIKELPGMISNLLSLILKSFNETLTLQKMIADISQIKYISPQHLLRIEGDKQYPILSLGGLVYTPDLISLLSKSHPQVLLDLNPFQYKLYDQLSEIDVSLGRCEDQVPCLILDIPRTFDDLYSLEIIQVIMESAKSLESSSRMDQVALVIQERILKSQKKLEREDSIFGILDSLFSVVESYFDRHHNQDMISKSLSDSCNLELGD